MVVRAQGYSATTVDELCAAAGVSKGAFFHHFKSKDDLATAAAAFWSETTGKLFATAQYHDEKDALQRILAYLDFRKALLAGEVPEFTCLVGTLLQETYDSKPDIRDACYASIAQHAATLEEDIAAAIETHKPLDDIDPSSLALHMQAVLQGAFILAKGQGSAAVAADSIEHLKRYIQLLFAER
jgi:TetR/AcrR family transcriptional repressor of nem operon